MIQTLSYILIKTFLNLVTAIEKSIRWVAMIIVLVLLYKLGTNILTSLLNRPTLPSWLSAVLYIITCPFSIWLCVKLEIYGTEYNLKLMAKWKLRHRGFHKTWRNKLAWFNAICLFLLALIIWFFITVDTEATQITYNTLLKAIHLLSRMIGIGYKPTLLALFYLLQLTEILSALILFFALFHDYKNRKSFKIFIRSGLCCIALYAFYVVSNIYSSVQPIIFESINQQCDDIYDTIVYWSRMDYNPFSEAPIGFHSVAYEALNIIIIPAICTIALNAILFVIIWNYKVKNEDKDVEIADDKEETDDNLSFMLLLLRTFLGQSYKNALDETNERIKNLSNNFDAQYMAQLTTDDECSILGNDEHKISPERLHAAVVNASIFLKLQQEYGSFLDYVCCLTDVEKEEFKIHSFSDEELSAKATILANDLRFRGFKYIGESAAIDLLMTLQHSTKRRKSLYEFRLFNRNKENKGKK